MLQELYKYKLQVVHVRGMMHYMKKKVKKLSTYCHKGIITIVWPNRATPTSQKRNYN